MGFCLSLFVRSKSPFFADPQLRVLLLPAAISLHSFKEEEEKNQLIFDSLFFFFFFARCPPIMHRFARIPVLVCRLLPPECRALGRVEKSAKKELKVVAISNKLLGVPGCLVQTALKLIELAKGEREKRLRAKLGRKEKGTQRDFFATSLFDGLYTLSLSREGTSLW